MAETIPKVYSYKCVKVSQDKSNNLNEILLKSIITHILTLLSHKFMRPFTFLKVHESHAPNKHSNLISLWIKQCVESNFINDAMSAEQEFKGFLSLRRV